MGEMRGGKAEDPQLRKRLSDLTTESNFSLASVSLISASDMQAEIQEH